MWMHSVLFGLREGTRERKIIKKFVNLFKMYFIYKKIIMDYNNAV